jgi:hypothetical protein
VNVAGLLVITNGVVDLAAIGTVGALVYTKRILFAATPKPQAQQQEAKP